MELTHKDKQSLGVQCHRMVGLVRCGLIDLFTVGGSGRPNQTSDRVLAFNIAGIPGHRLIKMHRLALLNNGQRAGPSGQRCARIEPMPWRIIDGKGYIRKGKLTRTQHQPCHERQYANGLHCASLQQSNHGYTTNILTRLHSRPRPDSDHSRTTRHLLGPSGCLPQLFSRSCSAAHRCSTMAVALARTASSSSSSASNTGSSGALLSLASQ